MIDLNGIKQALLTRAEDAAGITLTDTQFASRLVEKAVTN